MAERVGDFLIRIGAITAEQMAEVLKIQDAEEEPRLLGQIAIELGYIDDAAIQRLLGRASEQNRKDDTEEVIRHRIDLYHAQTEPLIKLYGERGKLIQVDGIGSIEEVADRVRVALSEFLDARG